MGHWPRLAPLCGQPGGLPSQALELQLIIGIIGGRLQPPDICTLTQPAPVVPAAEDQPELREPAPALCTSSILL